MKASFVCLIAFLVFLPITSPAAEEMRIWTNTQGKKVKAALVEIKDDNVILKSASSGNEFEFPLSQLSPADRVFVQQQQQQQKQSPQPGAAPSETDPQQRVFSRDEIDAIRTYQLVELVKELPNLAVNSIVRIKFDRVEKAGGLDEDCYWAYLSDSRESEVLEEGQIGLVACGEEGRKVVDKWYDRTKRTKKRTDSGGSMDLYVSVLPEDNERRTQLPHSKVVLLAVGDTTERQFDGSLKIIW